MQLSETLLGRQDQNDSGSKPTYIYWQNWMQGEGHHFAPQNSLVLPNIVIRIFFSFSCELDFFLCDFFTFFVSCPVLCVLWHDWPCTPSGGLKCSVWTCWQTTYIDCM